MNGTPYPMTGLGNVVPKYIILSFLAALLVARVAAIEQQSELLVLEEKLCKASVAGDVEVLKEWAMPNYVFSDPDGKTWDLDKMLDSYKDPDTRSVKDSRILEISEIHYPSTAIVVGVQEVTFLNGSMKEVKKFRFTDVFVRSEKAWRLAASHWSIYQ